MAPATHVHSVVLACLLIPCALGNDRHKCVGPFHHHIKLHVYNIEAMNATKGMTNKNGADTDVELAYIFGGTKEFPVPIGIEEYYDGAIQMAHVSVSSWGDFLQCDHAKGSTRYSCQCPKGHKGNCDKERAGKKASNHSAPFFFQTMYSFPHAGQGKYWDYESGNKTRGCMTIRVAAKCVIDKLAIAAGCPGICAAKAAATCAKCVNKLNATKKKEIWDNAIWDEGCPLVNSTRSENSEHYALLV